MLLKLYFIYNGHRKFFLGSFNNVDELIERMKDHQWAFSGITRPRFKKYIGKDDVRFDYGAVERQNQRAENHVKSELEYASIGRVTWTSDCPYLAKLTKAAAFFGK